MNMQEYARNNPAEVFVNMARSFKSDPMEVGEMRFEQQDTIFPSGFRNTDQIEETMNQIASLAVDGWTTKEGVGAYDGFRLLNEHEQVIVRFHISGVDGEPLDPDRPVPPFLKIVGIGGNSGRPYYEIELSNSVLEVLIALVKIVTAFRVEYCFKGVQA